MQKNSFDPQIRNLSSNFCAFPQYHSSFQSPCTVDRLTLVGEKSDFLENKTSFREIRRSNRKNRFDPQDSKYLGGFCKKKRLFISYFLRHAHLTDLQQFSQKIVIFLVKFEQRTELKQIFCEICRKNALTPESATF